MNCTNRESAAGISECSYRKLNEYAPLLTHEANNGTAPVRSRTLKICEASPRRTNSEETPQTKIQPIIGKDGSNPSAAMNPNPS